MNDNTIRDSIIDILYEVIKNKQITKKVEVGLYNWTIEFSEKNDILKKWSNQKFKNLYVRKAMSLYDNLNKKGYIKNNRLLTRLKKKQFEAGRLAFMSPSELFPENWKKEIDELTKINSKAWEDRVELATDQFTCSRCKESKCSYYELQTRSADEPMTCFITCLNCGKRWRQ